MTTTERNYRIVALSPERTVVVQVLGDERPRDTGVRPTEWGLFGLSAAEQRILRGGMTRRERREAREG